MEDKLPAGRGRGRGRGRGQTSAPSATPGPSETKVSSPPAEEPEESSASAGKSGHVVSEGNNSLISHVQVLLGTAKLRVEEESQDPNRLLEEDGAEAEAGGKLQLQLMFRLLGLQLLLLEVTVEEEVWECLLP